MNTCAPIDIVYLPVNENDPAWRAKRQLASEQLNPQQRQALAVYSNVEGRFRDNSELRYSLRALERFFPEHGHIYIVTDAQTPDWLRAHDQLTVIDHRDLIPPACLPTFDSGNIESYIHRIPQLSERYFYFNDDVFLGAPVNLKDWFWDDCIYAGWSDDPLVSDEPLREDATALDNACRLSNQWLRAKLKRRRHRPTYPPFVLFHTRHGPCSSRFFLNLSAWRPSYLRWCAPPSFGLGTSPRLFRILCCAGAWPRAWPR